MFLSGAKLIGSRIASARLDDSVIGDQQFPILGSDWLISNPHHRLRCNKKYGSSNNQRNQMLGERADHIWRIKDEIFCFVHFRWCNLMDGIQYFEWWTAGYPLQLNIGCPSILTPSKMGRIKDHIFHSHSSRIVLFLQLSAWLICQKYYYIILLVSFE